MSIWKITEMDFCGLLSFNRVIIIEQFYPYWCNNIWIDQKIKLLWLGRRTCFIYTFNNFRNSPSAEDASMTHFQALKRSSSWRYRLFSRAVLALEIVYFLRKINNRENAKKNKLSVKYICCLLFRFHCSQRTQIMYYIINLMLYKNNSFYMLSPYWNINYSIFLWLFLLENVLLHVFDSSLFVGYFYLFI